MQARADLAIGALADRAHGFHGLARVFALGGLAREHHGVGAVDDRVGHVAGLGAGRARVLDHGVEHLGGGDHHFTYLVAAADDALLRKDHFLGRDLHAHVAAGDHDAVSGGEDVLKVVEAFLVFDLADDLNIIAAVGVEELADVQHVAARSRKRGGDEVDMALDAKEQILFVLL